MLIQFDNPLSTVIQLLSVNLIDLDWLHFSINYLYQFSLVFDKLVQLSLIIS